MGTQGLASGEQARRTTDWSGERGQERAETKGRRQQETGRAAVSLTPDVEGAGSGSLLDAILSTVLKK